ncbi:hypothetical protein GYMLUDRAFT_49646 [Collybiopsis luxurians FD-317 M1]|uniref:Non-specific serine/threonine protein kinase n=1 Tax=Collybiopsis luxurians FD-317 M1 TaxID=944289 RepID=A0A0D0ARK6_9AGAR|nr:hypothetical protein GYMLUDRAFT_49646 [Collybiopsis luxurians FD-317 M1]
MAENENLGEVKALKLVGELVAAGMMEKPRPSNSWKDRVKDKLKSLSQHKSMVPVIVAKKKEGVYLPDTPVYERADFEGQNRIALSVKKLICSEAARMAVEKNMFHDDRILGNALVTMNSATGLPASVKLIDWGKARGVRKGAKMLDVYQYCVKTTRLFEDVDI